MTDAGYFLNSFALFKLRDGFSQVKLLVGRSPLSGFRFVNRSAKRIDPLQISRQNLRDREWSHEDGNSEDR